MRQRRYVTEYTLQLRLKRVGVGDEVTKRLHAVSVAPHGIASTSESHKSTNASDFASICAFVARKDCPGGQTSGAGALERSVQLNIEKNWAYVR